MSALQFCSTVTKGYSAGLENPNRNQNQALLRSSLVQTLFCSFAFLIQTISSSVISSEFVSNTLFWSQNLDQNNNETFYMPVTHLNVNDTGCEVGTNLEYLCGVKAYNQVPGPEQTGNFSQIIAVNLTLSGTVGTLPKNESTTIIMTEYIAVKYSPEYYYELGVYYNISNGKTFMDYRDYRLDKVVPNMTNLSITYSTPGVVRAWIAKDANMVFEVCYETITDTVYIYFKVGYFNATVSGNFRKTMLFSFPNNLNLHDLGVRLKDVQLTSLGIHEGSNYQFIVSNRNSSLIYLVTCVEGLAKAGRLVVSPVQTNITLNRFLYVENQFLVIEQNTTFPDVNNKPVASYMNYYLEHYIGMKLSASDFTNIRNLSRGRLINTYNSMETNLVLLDFLMPDLDGVIDETPLTSLYYSKENQRFETFLEEFSINKQGQSYINGTYYRTQTKDYLVEIYTQPNRSQFPIMSLTHRKTNRDAGEVMLPNNRRIRWLYYFKVDNVLMIKYEVPAAQLMTEKHTQILVLQEPYVSYTLKPATAPPTPTRLLQEGEENGVVSNTRNLQIDEVIPNVFNLGVNCRHPEASATSMAPKLIVNFTLAREEGEYFNIIRKNPDNLPPQAEKLLAAMNAEKQITGLNPNGVEMNFAVRNLTRGSFYELWVTKNGSMVDLPLKNMRRDIYKIRLPNLEVSMPVLFEQRANNRASTTLILDLAGRTSYYKLDGRTFKFSKDAQDSRNLSSVSMLSSGNAIINISKNIFAFDVNEVKERPLTGVGSFCVNVENIQSSDSASFLMCLTEDSVQIQYTKEIFAAEGTVLPFVGPDFASVLKKYMLIKMMYSLTYPSHVLMLAHTRVSLLARSYEVQIYETFVSSRIRMSMIMRAPLDQLGASMKVPGVKLLFADLLDDRLVFVTSAGEIFVYQITRNFVIGEKFSVKFVRKYLLSEHFKPFKITIDGNMVETSTSASIGRVVKLEVVDIGRNNVRGEKFTVKKIGMQISVSNLRLKKQYDIVVVFNPLKSSYSAFDVVFSGSKCSKVFMGPMFLNEGEKSERRLVVACVPGKPDRNLDPKKPIDADIYVLSELGSRFDLSDEGSIPELNQLTDFSIKARETTEQQEYNYKASWTKSYYMLDFLENLQDKSRYDSGQWDRIRPTKNFKVNYADTFKKFSSLGLNDTDKSLKVQETEESTAFGLLSKKTKTEINRPLPNYFEGHIYSSQISCESYIECRDKIINGTGSLLNTFQMPSFPMKEWRLGSRQRYGVIDVSSGKDEQPAVHYAIDDNTVMQYKDGKIEQYTYAMVDSNCTDFVSVEFYLVTVCIHKEKYNFFLVIDMRLDYSWFYIQFSLPSKRLIGGRDARLQISENYLILTTYNPFFKRFLTVYLFKVNQHSQYDSSERILSFSSPLNKNLSFVFFAETPMNDEFITVKPFRPNLANPVTYNPLVSESMNTTEIVYVFCLRRLTSTSYSMRLDAYEIKNVPSSVPGSKMFTLQPKRIAQERTMVLNFSVAEQMEYLIDEASLLCLNMDDPQLLDVVVHLPHAHDYLLRINRTFVESDVVKPFSEPISLFNSTKVLVISNPFFGAVPNHLVAPLFDKDYYYVAGVYYRDRSFIRCYYLNEDLKKKAQPFQNPQQTFFFNFEETSTNSGVIQEKYFMSGYTYAVLGFDGGIRTIQIRQSCFEKGDFLFNRTTYTGKILSLTVRSSVHLQEHLHHLHERYLPESGCITPLHFDTQLPLFIIETNHFALTRTFCCEICCHRTPIKEYQHERLPDLCYSTVRYRSFGCCSSVLGQTLRDEENLSAAQIRGWSRR